MIFVPHRRVDRKLEIKSVRIILFALCGGMLALCGVAVGVSNARTLPIEEPRLNIMLIVLAGLAASEVIVFFAMRVGYMRSLMNRAPAEGVASEAADESARQAFLTLRIIAAAMAEGVGLFAAIVCISTGSMLPLVAIPPAIVIVLLQFPTESQLRRFLSECARKHVR